MKIYEPLVVKQLKAFYGKALYDMGSYSSVKEHLAALARLMQQGIAQQQAAVYPQITNYHPEFLGVPLTQIEAKSWSLADCQHTIANEYGFASWETVSQKPYNEHFEQAVNQLLAGKLKGLLQMLEKHPKLLKETSAYGHKATLLHYCGSNGVELWRQQVPENLPEIVAFLIASGADKEAKMRVYGGAYTTLQLLTTSAHPVKAGVHKAVEKLLKT